MVSVPIIKNCLVTSNRILQQIQLIRWSVENLKKLMYQNCAWLLQNCQFHSRRTNLHLCVIIKLPTPLMTTHCIPIIKANIPHIETMAMHNVTSRMAGKHHTQRRQAIIKLASYSWHFMRIKALSACSVHAFRPNQFVRILSKKCIPICYSISALLVKYNCFVRIYSAEVIFEWKIIHVSWYWYERAKVSQFSFRHESSSAFRMFQSH